MKPTWNERGWMQLHFVHLLLVTTWSFQFQLPLKSVASRKAEHLLVSSWWWRHQMSYLSTDFISLPFIGRFLTVIASSATALLQQTNLFLKMWRKIQKEKKIFQSGSAASDNGAFIKSSNSPKHFVQFRASQITQRTKTFQTFTNIHLSYSFTSFIHFIVNIGRKLLHSHCQPFIWVYSISKRPNSKFTFLDKLWPTSEMSLLLRVLINPHNEITINMKLTRLKLKVELSVSWRFHELQHNDCSKLTIEIASILLINSKE